MNGSEKESLAVFKNIYLVSYCVHSGFGYKYENHTYEAVKMDEKNLSDLQNEIYRKEDTWPTILNIFKLDN